MVNECAKNVVILGTYGWMSGLVHVLENGKCMRLCARGGCRGWDLQNGCVQDLCWLLSACLLAHQILCLPKMVRKSLASVNSRAVGNKVEMVCGTLVDCLVLI